MQTLGKDATNLPSAVEGRTPDLQADPDKSPDQSDFYAPGQSFKRNLGSNISGGNINSPHQPLPKFSSMNYPFHCLVLKLRLTKG